MQKTLPLGGKTQVADPNKNKDNNLNNQLKDLKLKLESFTEMFRMLRKQADKKYLSEKQAEQVVEEGDVVNKDGLPLKTSYIGITSKSPYPYMLLVDIDGTYKVGNKEFTSLSSAAEFVSGVRRSGWTFWRLLDGRTIKEVYRNK